MTRPTNRATALLTPGELEVLRAVEERACRGGYRARYEHYRWAEAAGLWALKIKLRTRPEERAA